MTDMMHSRPRRSVLEHVEKGPDGAVVQPVLAAPVPMNPTALALWELCDGQTEVAEMVEAVCALFEVEPTLARTEVETALAEMTAAGVIR